MEYQQPPPPPGGQGPKERPTGITILAVLYIIGGLYHYASDVYCHNAF